MPMCAQRRQGEMGDIATWYLKTASVVGLMLVASTASRAGRLSHVEAVNIDRTGFATGNDGVSATSSVAIWSPQISGNGRYVAFETGATNITTSGTPVKPDFKLAVFVRDLKTR